MTSCWLMLVVTAMGLLNAEPLWTVGRADRSAAEFALAPEIGRASCRERV